MVSLATSCKRINTLAQDNLTLHQQRIKKYQNVTLWGCFRHRDQPHPIFLLRDICNDWRVAYYARSLAIECCGRDPVDPGPDEYIFVQAALIAQDSRTVRSVLPGITIPVRKMLSMALRWDEAKIDNVFWKMEYGAWGARGAVLGLLIVSLPAIKSISFKHYLWHDEFWIDSLKSITDQQDSYSGATKPNFLMDVSELNLIDQDEGTSVGISSSIIPFVSLPSLRVIRGVSVESYSFDDYHFADNDGLPPSPVTEVDLQRTSLPADYLKYFLRYSHLLKRFRYDRGPQADSLRGGAEPGGITKALLEWTSPNLESLVFTGATGSRSPHDENIKGSLRNFKVLKEFHLPSNAFLTYTSQGNCRSLPTEDIPRLVDILPASIETVRLDGEMTWEEITALLIGMPEDRIKCLPKLKEILFTVGGNQGKAPMQVKALAHLDQKHGMVFQLDEATGYARGYSGRFVF